MTDQPEPDEPMPDAPTPQEQALPQQARQEAAPPRRPSFGAYELGGTRVLAVVTTTYDLEGNRVEPPAPQP